MQMRGGSFPVLVGVVALAGCSGGDNFGQSTVNSMPPPVSMAARGTLIQSPPPRTASFTATSLMAAFSGSPAGQQLLGLIATPKCGIDVHYLQYNTVAPDTSGTTASAAMMVPTGSDPACQGSRPLVVYARATRVERAVNQANLADPNNNEALLATMVFAAQGYVLITPNYTGYDSSTLSYHPYLNADQESNDMVDALAAARSALPTSFAPSVTDSGKLFLTGYSQGGHVAMATHRLLQQSGGTITASAPMSGPYALVAAADAVFQGQVGRTAPLFFTYISIAFQRAYGNLYTNPTDVFEARYVAGIESLLPSTAPPTQVFTTGRLPVAQLFNNIAPAPAFEQFTPATQPAAFADVYASAFGSTNLVTNAFRQAYLQDAQLNPDGGFPTVTDGQPPANPVHPGRQALKRNDLRNWVPTAPVLLCAGSQDPTVSYRSTQLMRDYWAANGATANVSVLDLDSGAAPNDPAAALKAGFAASKQAVAQAAMQGGATDNGRSAVIDAYHGSLVPPFCLSAVKAFFDAR